MFKIVSLILLAYIAMSLLLYLAQRSMMYFPTPESHSTGAEPIWLENEGYRLKIWRINRGADALIYFGGNAEAVELNIGDFANQFPKHSIYLVNYRGYGGSEGKPTEQALFSDALMVYDHIAKDHHHVDIIGRSLGSGVAVYVAANRKPRRMALITPYDSIAEVAQSHYPVFPARWLIKDRYDSVSRVRDIKCDTLVLLSETDRVVPHKHSHRLMEALAERLVDRAVIAATHHGDIGVARAYWRRLREFFGESHVGG